MKLPSWLNIFNRRKPARPPSLTDCPKCGREMDMIEKSTMSGDDMRTYRCDHCQEEHIVNYGVALWKVLSDARRSENDTS
jgi:transposase-like protein